jgi:hypothetical protein
LHPKTTPQLTENHFLLKTNHAGRTATDMTDENTAPNQPGSLLEAIMEKLGIDQPEFWIRVSDDPVEFFIDPNPIAEPELPVNSKLDDEIRKFEFKRRLEKIQFQVREEFKVEAAKLALELWRSKPLADALSQPGPCDGDLHSKIMPWRGDV